MVRDNSGDAQPKPQSFSYTYDPNGNVTDLTDSSPNAQYDAYAYAYDGLTQLLRLPGHLEGTGGRNRRWHGQQDLPVSARR